MNRTRTFASVAVLAFALLATACGGGGGGSGPATPATPAAARPSSTATLAIVEPANEATVAPGTLTVRLDLQGAHIVDAATTTLKPDLCRQRDYAEGPSPWDESAPPTWPEATWLAV